MSDCTDNCPLMFILDFNSVDYFNSCEPFLWCVLHRTCTSMPLPKLVMAMLHSLCCVSGGYVSVSVSMLHSHIHQTTLASLFNSFGSFQSTIVTGQNRCRFAIISSFWIQLKPKIVRSKVVDHRL